MVEVRELIINNFILKCYVEDEVVYFQREDLSFLGFSFNDDFVSLTRLLEIVVDKESFLFDFVFKVINEYIINGFYVNEQLLVSNQSLLEILNKKVIHLNELYMYRRSLSS